MDVNASCVSPVINNCVITSSKQSVDQLGYRLVDPQLFDNVMTKFLINNRTDA